MDSIYLLLFEATLLVCLFIACVLWWALRKNKLLTEENQCLRAEINQIKQLDQHNQSQQHNQPPEDPPTAAPQKVLNTESQKTPNAAPQKKEPTAQEQLFGRLCQLMDSPEQIYTDPDLDRCRLARLLGTNEHYVSDAISACTNGGSTIDFINGYRLRYAVQLLTTTDDSIALIAELSGFSRRSFYRVFDEAYSMSPTEYRKAVKR